MPTAVADRRTKRLRIRRQRYSWRSVAVRLPVAPRALLVAAAIPLLFLHSEFQPSISVHVGGTSVDAYLTDFAVLAVVLGAVAAAGRGGIRRLVAGRVLWLVAAVFFLWLVFEVAWGRHE